LSTYVDDYHAQVDRLCERTPGTEIIAEYYVPRAELPRFMIDAADVLRRYKAEPIYGTVRLIERDTETFLPWARQAYACIVLNLHTEHSVGALRRTAAAFRALIDAAIAYDGSFFLTYHRYATRQQVETCYPQFRRFLAEKRQWDPQGIFASDWHRHYARLFSR
jgi:FAD/FMN-containing dehydrogenase